MGGAYRLSSNQNISIDTIAGTYQTTVSNRLSQIQLNRDGSFIHEYDADRHAQSNKPKTNTGTWDIEETPSGKNVVLHNFITFPGEEIVGGGLGVDGGWFLLLINKFFGDVRLIYDMDLGLSYKRLPSRP
jgi:hypothetical protein